MTAIVAADQSIIAAIRHPLDITIGPLGAEYWYNLPKRQVTSCSP